MRCKAKNIERAAQAQLLCNKSSADGIMSRIPRHGKKGVSECETMMSKGTCCVRHYYVGITIAFFPSQQTRHFDLNFQFYVKKRNDLSFNWFGLNGVKQLCMFSKAKNKTKKKLERDLPAQLLCN